jgi:rhodanese-related sulfurtransferase
MQPANFLRILGIALALSAYSALTLAVKQPPPIASEVTELQVPAGIRLIRLSDAKALWHDSGTIFVDVRSLTDYEFGHIAGAVSLPETDVEQRLPEWLDRFRQARAIIIYCKSRDCGQSLWAAIRLHNAGLSQAMIFPGGWNEWFNDGLPVSRVRQ